MTASLQKATRAMARVVIDELEHFEKCHRKDREREVFLNRGTEDSITPALQAEEAGRVALRQAPFVMFVRAQLNGQFVVRLICRQSIPDHDPRTRDCDFVSYLSPMGRLAAIPVGEQGWIKVPIGNVRVTVVERDQFQSVKRAAWDAINNLFTSVIAGAHRIASLRDLLESPADQKSQSSAHSVTATASEPPAHEEPQRKSAAKRAEAEKAVPVQTDRERDLETALRRSKTERKEMERAAAAQMRAAQGINKAFELRDQAILDAMQDGIFRLPIASQVIVTGAPGTGKTTVLIKRIAQKTYRDGLTDEEKAGITQAQLAILLDRHRSWVLFTPNDLLRNYVKEALGKEHLEVTSKTVVTWSDQRVRLARDVFRVLRVGGKGVFKRSSEALLDLRTPESALRLLEEFREYWSEETARVLTARWTLLDEAWDASEGIPAPTAREQGRSAASFAEAYEAIRALYRTLGGVRGRTKLMSVAASAAAHRGEYQKARRALESLGDELAVEVGFRFPLLMERIRPEETREEALRRLTRRLLRPSKSSTANVEEEEEQRGEAPEPDVLDVIDDQRIRIRIQSARAWQAALRSADQLTSGYDLLFGETITAYRRFRRRIRRMPHEFASLLTEQGNRPDADNLIGDEELDLLLFELLRLADGALERSPKELWSDRLTGTLRGVRDELRAIVTVDEATDFSWPQLGCMYYLAHPMFRAFSMSGDLMQRVTRRGLRSWSECAEFAPELQVHELRRVYRQSRSLLRVASALYRLAMNDEAPFESPLPDRPEPLPLLIRADRERGIEWVAERIVEVYGICGQLPSLGVFVPHEADVSPVAETLRARLEEHAIEVEACAHGKVLGTGDRVRVFAIEHIKGLEFQGVFLVDFDQLSGWDTDLVDKYLYVGLTRAAEFLAVTVRRGLPSQIHAVEAEFSSGDWSHFGAEDFAYA